MSLAKAQLAWHWQQNKGSKPSQDVIRSLKAASDNSDYYDIEFWTWQRDYTVKFKKSVFSSYLACLVYGFLED